MADNKILRGMPLLLQVISPGDQNTETTEGVMKKYSRKTSIRV
jgi:hypothetical protein